jgi:hypothetical protein
MFRALAFMPIVFCLAAFPAEKIVRANDDNDLVEQRQPAYDVDPINIEPRKVAADIDNWVYGIDRSETRGAELSLLSQLQRRVNMLARSMLLSESQIDQLSLAGQGDIHRFMDRVDELKARFGHARVGPDTWRAILQECRPLQNDFRRGVFAEPSLFSKMMARIMTVEQIRQSKQIARERRLFHHQAGVHMTVLRLSTALGLSGEQQTQLKKLLLQETRPARTLDGVNPAGYFSVVYAQLPRIPERKLRPLFEPWQWQGLKAKLASAPDVNDANLESAGDEEDEGGPAALLRSLNAEGPHR